MVNLIDKVDQRLKDWVGSVIEGQPVNFRAPGDKQAEFGICLYLMAIREKKAPAGAGPAPLQVSLQYLVTTRAAEPEQAHNVLGRMLFAAMENSEFEVELEPVTAEVWSAFGVPPQPAFLLQVPLRKERAAPVAGRVRQPPIVKTAPLAAFRGVVVGPGNIPLPGARVEIPLMRLSTTTDHKGAFQFTALPSGLAIQLHVQAKGKALSLTAAEDRADAESPFVIQFPALEE